jgi:hypothetical protein
MSKGSRYIELVVAGEAETGKRQPRTSGATVVADYRDSAGKRILVLKPVVAERKARPKAKVKEQPATVGE